MSPEEAVAILKGLNPNDPESAHSRADEVLLAVVPDKVAAAYNALQNACDWWAYA